MTEFLFACFELVSLRKQMNIHMNIQRIYIYIYIDE